MGRKFLAAKENLAEKINEIAKERGRTVFSIVNETLSAFISANEWGRDLTTLMEDAKILEIAKNSGMVLIPEPLHEYLMESTPFDSKMKEYWRSSGIVFGRYLDLNNIKDLKKVERILKEVVGINPDISISNERLVCISPRLGEKRSETVAIFLEGVMNGMGFRVASREVSKGIIILKFKQEREL
ncbi:MAG: ribbon-helix-helix domain-containing protein [Candidatus Methanomethyliaceae archaeon]|nr:ribbon-helix-helix domain-containing protein [Candidatus Methanomethyliaceae archaeon]